MAGTPTCNSRALAMRRASRKRARGLPRWSTTESSESTTTSTIFLAPTTETSETSTSRPATTKTTAKPAAASPTTATTGKTSGPGPQTAPHATVFVAAAPTDPAELDRLADQLAADETALRSPATPAADIPALARRQQAAYRALSARPAAMARVLPRLPDALRSIAQA